jgi:TIR domain-containing protein
MNAQVEEFFDVFLSHAHGDADVVELLATKLEDDAQFKVWLDRWVLVPGEHWQQDIARALDHAKTCAVCISQHTPKGWFRCPQQQSSWRTSRPWHPCLFPIKRN